MPTYTFERPDGTRVVQKLTMTEYELVKDGTMRLVDDEGATLTLVFDPGNLGFVMKDGPSGGWATKAMKENRYRQARGQEMTRREKDHVHKNRLVPNYNGQEGGSWADVQDHVRMTKGEASARTYDSLVSQEKKSL